MYDPIWICKDGRQMHLCEMTDSHLLNCANKIMRSRSGWRLKWLPRIVLEIQIRNMGMSSRRAA